MLDSFGRRHFTQEAAFKRLSSFLKVVTPKIKNRGLESKFEAFFFEKDVFWEDFIGFWIFWGELEEFGGENGKENF